MTSDPELSILVLTRDGAGLLERLLGSFAQHNSFDRFEIIVVDHASTDRTKEVVTAWSGRLPLRTIDRDRNFSYSNSNNKAARFAKGSRLLLLNNDIVFEQDVIPSMLKILDDDGVGAVGIKHIARVGVGDAVNFVDHMGIYFNWYAKDGYLRPYNVTPNASNWTRSKTIGVYPSVSAAMMLCRKDDYFAVGGLDEGYMYGFEDLDFCLKIAHRLKKRVVSFNGGFVVHEKNTTRAREKDSLDRYREANQRRFQNRWSRRLRRSFLQSLVEGDLGFADRPLRLGIATIEGEEDRARGFGSALQRLFGWSVTYVPRDGWGAVAGLDLYVCLSAELEISRLQQFEPNLVRIGWITNLAPWLSSPALHDYDLLFCNGLPDRRVLRHDRGARCALMPTVAPEGLSADSVFDRCARGFRRTLAAFAGRPRIAIKLPESPRFQVVAWELAKNLRLLGERVRVDEPGNWGTPARWADEVTISVGAAPYAGRFAEQVNVFWLQGPGSDGFAELKKYDLVLADNVAAVEALRAAGCDARLSGPPEEGPGLLDRAQEIRWAVIELAAAPDPDQARAAESPNPSARPT